MSNTPKKPADAGPRSSDQLGLVEKMRGWLDGDTTHSSAELMRAAMAEIERLNSVARGNFEAAVDALDGCRIDVDAAVAAERERCAKLVEWTQANFPDVSLDGWLLAAEIRRA